MGVEGDIWCLSMGEGLGVGEEWRWSMSSIDFFSSLASFWRRMSRSMFSNFSMDGTPVDVDNDFEVELFGLLWSWVDVEDDP